MSKDNVIALIQPGEFADQLTDMLREGSQRLILQAVEADFASFLDKYAPERLADGRQRVVRHGHLPERKIMTGIGAVPVSVPRSRDRQSSDNKAAQSQDFSSQGKQGANDKIRFVSQLLPPYVRRSKSVEMALPYLYLKGISSGDFCEVMPVLLGKDAVVGFSADTILRLRKQWKEELDQWNKRRLDSKNYVYIWADGVYLSARLEDEKQCLLVIMGATPEGKKELIGFTSGYRESTQSWRELLLDLVAKGLELSASLP